MEWALRTILMNGLSPRPFGKVSVGVKEGKSKGAHVSQSIGNSLCSHPALLMSAFGGISKGDDGGKQKKMVHNEAANQLTDQLEDDSAADPNLKIWFGHTLSVIDRTARGRWTQHA